jgi:hypothetical protein
MISDIPAPLESVDWKNVFKKWCRNQPTPPRIYKMEKGWRKRHITEVVCAWSKDSSPTHSPTHQRTRILRVKKDIFVYEIQKSVVQVTPPTHSSRILRIWEGVGFFSSLFVCLFVFFFCFCFCFVLFCFDLFCFVLCFFFLFYEIWEKLWWKYFWQGWIPLEKKPWIRACSFYRYDIWRRRM